MHPFHYRLFGLTIASALDLPELERVAPAHADITIALADGPTGRGYPLDIEDVALFEIEGGAAIRIVPHDPAIDPRDIRLFLLGSAMGAALHQRGLLPLHANAVVVDGRAFAFLGHSGAGKSTLAAWFHDRGLALLADDVCVVRIDAAGRALAYPGLPRLRLWQDALDASGRTRTDHRPSFSRQETPDEAIKFDVLLDPAALAPDPAPLGGLFLLESGPPGLHRLGGVEAVEALSANTYRGHLVGELGDMQAHLDTCLALVRTVPVFRWSRPFDRADFDATAEAILKECQALAPPRG